MEEFLDQVYYHNTVRDYLVVAGIIVLSILVLRAFKRLFINRLRALAAKTEGKVDDFMIDGLDRFIRYLIRQPAVTRRHHSLAQRRQHTPQLVSHLAVCA